MINKCLIYLIVFYQRFISMYFFPSCRFYPTCSSYAIISIKKFGFFYGLYLISIRLLKCHPYNNSNYYDPL